MATNLPIYDEEYVVKDLEAIYKAQLNDAIAAVNAQKADAITLVNIPTDQYVFQTIDPDKVYNWKGYFVMFGLINSSPKEIQKDNFIDEISVVFEVGTIDPGYADRDELIYRLLRYRKALVKVIMDNPDVFRGYGNGRVTRLEPSALPLDENGDRVILKLGIVITASITAV